MDRAQLLERLMVTYLGELSEHVRALNGDLLALEKDPEGPGRAERFKSLFRSVHSLKGASRSVSVRLIEQTCHHLEAILTEARDGRLPLNSDLFGLLFATADAIEEAGMRLREEHDLSDALLAGLLPRLERAIGGALIPLPAPVVEPSAASAATTIRPIALEPGTVQAPITATFKEPSALAEQERAVGGAAFVRVPAEKLDSLLTRSGELLLARWRVLARSEKLKGLRATVASWSKSWHADSQPLGALLHSDRLSGLLPPRTINALAQVGERLCDLDEELESFLVRSTGDYRNLLRAAGALDEEIRRVRMLPFAEACHGLDRTARDVARERGKVVDVIVEGGDVELDRSVLEGLKDPLTHLVRNAVDHGLEAPENRRATGKPETGTVTITASLRGAQVEVVVTDDGAGFDLDALRRRARELGYAESADDRDLIDLIFLPGFSTAPLITNISGRGVGLDVVKSNVEALHGTISVATVPGQCVRFTLAVPLTLTTLRALLLRAGGQYFVLPCASVRKLIRIDTEDLRTVEGRDVLVNGGPLLPVAVLAEVLGLPNRDPERANGKQPGLIVTAGDRSMAFLVDELIAEQEIVIKGLGGRLRKVRNLSGATILPDGKIALVLNPASLVRAALGRGQCALPFRGPAEAVTVARKRLLVVDDSVTTRTLEKSILEAAGYEVTTAVDGRAGWTMLQERGADLVITDIEMPLMDGFELTETIKHSSRFAHLPVILFSSRASERDQTRGIEVGADAYIVKSAFDQKDLLETIAQLL